MRILVTFAVEAEFAPWRKLRRFQKSRMADVDYFSAQISGAEIDVLFTGIGGKSAWLETANAIYKSEIDVCISSGLAGGLRPEHQIGEILVAEKVLASPGDLVVLSEPLLVKSAVAMGAKRVPFFYTADRVVLRAAESMILAHSLMLSKWKVAECCWKQASLRRGPLPFGQSATPPMKTCRWTLTGSRAILGISA